VLSHEQQLLCILLTGKVHCRCGSIEYHTIKKNWCQRSPNPFQSI